MVLQHRASAASSSVLFLRPRLLGHLLTRPLWLAGVALGAVGLSLHVLALDLGALALVQPLLVASLLFALPFSAWLNRRRPAAGEWGWAAATVLALGAFLVLSLIHI